MVPIVTWIIGSVSLITSRIGSKGVQNSYYSDYCFLFTRKWEAPCKNRLRFKIISLCLTICGHHHLFTCNCVFQDQKRRLMCTINSQNGTSSLKINPTFYCVSPIQVIVCEKNFTRHPSGGGARCDNSASWPSKSALCIEEVHLPLFFFVLYQQLKKRSES